MRKVEVLEYNCPICNADLWPIANDFSVDKERGEKTVTTMQCQGCKEKFYTEEEAHVSPEDKRPLFNCRYCGRQCGYLSLKDDWSDYWRCLPCRVTYEQRYSPGYTDVQTINMYTTINGKLYVMRQFIDRNRTRVELLPENLEDTVVIAQEFPFLFPNVTPFNVAEKLLTYLIFS